MVVAGGADHEGLAPPSRHDRHPFGLLCPGVSEICQGADVVRLNVARALTDLAGVREEPGDELVVRMVHPDRLTVDDRRRSLPLQWNAAEPDLMVSRSSGSPVTTA